MKKINLFKTPSLFLGTLAALTLITSASIITLYQIQQQQKTRSRAELQSAQWYTSQSAITTCSPYGNAIITATFNNNETDPSKSINVFITDNQTGKSINLGTIKPKETKSGIVDTGLNSLNSNNVTFSLTWTNGYPETDSRKAQYAAITRYPPTPTYAPISYYPTPTCTPRPPQCGPDSNLGIYCPATPPGGWCPIPTPSYSPTSTPTPTTYYPPTPTLAAASCPSKTFATQLTGGKETPPNQSYATGNAQLKLNYAETEGILTLTFSGLSSAQTAAHIHGPALAGQEADPIITIPNSQVTNFSFPITYAQLTQLKQGLWYINVHTTNLPKGEIRGQLICAAAEIPTNTPTLTPSPTTHIIAYSNTPTPTSPYVKPTLYCLGQPCPGETTPTPSIAAYVSPTLTYPISTLTPTPIVIAINSPTVQPYPTTEPQAEINPCATKSYSYNSKTAKECRRHPNRREKGNKGLVNAILKLFRNLFKQTPSPVPAPYPTPSPEPTCTTRPACLDANPKCLIPEPAEGWCQEPAPQQDDPQGLLGELLKLLEELKRLLGLTQPTPTSTPPPEPTLSIAPTCAPRPACLDAEPRCIIPEPINGWCPSPSATAAPTETPIPTPTPEPTNTPTPTNTPIPTETPTPTNTPEPTNTPTPTDTPVPTQPTTQTPQPQSENPILALFTAILQSFQELLNKLLSLLK